MKHKPPATLDTWELFAAKMYKEWDADPGYYALQHTQMSDARRLRLAIAWCAFYNLGIAADACQYSGANFWQYLRNVYPTAQRSSERRHFRGAAGLKALDQWERTWLTPEKMAEYILAKSSTYFGIRKQCQSVYLYGDYFVWKWCDLHEVLGYGSVNMIGSETYSPKVPQQGALLIWHQDHMPEDKPDMGYIVPHVYHEIAEHCRKAKIPPRTTKDRAFGIQESETVCCVYKQMASGSYTYGTRTAKAVRRLRGAGSSLAQDMADTLLDLSPYTEEELNARLDSLTTTKKR
jgi:hypothetical protein